MDIQWHIDQRLVHEIHTSERRSFRGCRRRWDWIFRQNYYPKTTAKPLEFGVAYHKAMEVFYLPETWTWDSNVRANLAIKAFVDKCEEQKKKYLAWNDRQLLDDDVEEDYRGRVQLGRGMLKYYFNEVSPREDVGWTPIRVEVEFMVIIPHPETKGVIWCKCQQCFDRFCKWIAKGAPNGPWPLGVSSDNFQGLPVVYAGRIDMLAQDKNDDLWIFDWKTARTIPEEYEFLFLDDQVGSYPWALRVGLNLNVAGFIYHAQRKGFPQEPKENKQRRLGCLFSVNKTQEVDYATYLKCIQEKDPEAYRAGYYDDMLRFLREEGITYFARHQIHKSELELEEIERNIGLEALDMTQSDLRIYPSPGRFSCNFCAFQQPCIERNGQGDYQYALDTLFERREHYYVRREPSTETKGGE